MKFHSLIAMIVLFASTTAYAAKPTPSPDAPKPKTSEVPKSVGNRSKSLSFDDAVMEGMNRNPLDSIESVGKEDAARQPHLYNKRLHFRKELKDSVKESGYQP